MSLFATIARHRLGLLLGGEAGATLTATATATMSAAAIASPPAIAAMLSPAW